VLFQSKATNVLQGVADNNGLSDVFLYRRSSGAVSLLSHSVGSAATTANGDSTDPVMSADGASVLYLSSAPDLVRGVLDGNGTIDVFLARIDGLFRSGFE
jgi:Tol biopolymer transport system component